MGIFFSNASITNATPSCIPFIAKGDGISPRRGQRNVCAMATEEIPRWTRSLDTKGCNCSLLVSASSFSLSSTAAVGRIVYPFIS